MAKRNDIKMLIYACDLYAMSKDVHAWRASITFIMKGYM